MYWEEFRRFLESQNVNPSTVKAYVYTARAFERMFDPGSAGKREVSEFLSSYSQYSRPRHIAALKRFFEFLGRPGVMEGFRMVWPERSVVLLDVGQVARVIETAKRTSPLDYALVRLGYDLALRVGEVVRLDKTDVANDRVRVRLLKKRGLVVVEKPLYDKTREALEWYLSTRLDGDPALLVSRLGRRISVNTVEYRFRRLLEKAGVDVPSGQGFHLLRHARAGHLRRSGVPLDVIKEFLGHSRYDTTLVYAHLGYDVVVNEVKPPDV